MYHKHIDVSKYTPQIPFPQGGGQRRTMNDEQDNVQDSDLHYGN